VVVDDSSIDQIGLSIVEVCVSCANEPLWKIAEWESASPATLMICPADSGGTTYHRGELGGIKRQRYDSLLAQQTSLDRLIGTLERFNGTSYVQIGTDGVISGTGAASAAIYDSDTGEQSNGRVYVTLSQSQLDLLNQSFKALEEAVFKSLAVETWVKPYVDQIGLTFDAATGFAFDFTQMQSSLDALRQMYASKAAFTLVGTQAANGTWRRAV
jgi:hypothetical protein